MWPPEDSWVIFSESLLPFSSPLCLHIKMLWWGMGLACMFWGAPVDWSLSYSVLVLDFFGCMCRAALQCEVLIWPGCLPYRKAPHFCCCRLPVPTDRSLPQTWVPFNYNHLPFFSLHWSAVITDWLFPTMNMCERAHLGLYIAAGGGCQVPLLCRSPPCFPETGSLMEPGVPVVLLSPFLLPQGWVYRYACGPSWLFAWIRGIWMQVLMPATTTPIPD